MHFLFIFPSCKMFILLLRSAVSWQLTLHPLESPKKAIEGDNHESVSKVDGELCIFIFRSLISKDKAVTYLIMWQS